MATLLEHMREYGLTDYGSVITGQEVRDVIGIELPEVPTMADFKDAQLREMAAVQTVKEVLLDEGKYLKSAGDAYRILLPSENLAQIANYEAAADRKLKRGRRLLASTPPAFRGDTHADAMRAARIAAKASQRKRGAV